MTRAAALTRDDPTRPRLRGVIHRYATFVAVVLFAVLVARTPGGGDRVAIAVYGACVTAMLGVSAVYHSGRLSAVWFRRMKRLDHATILLAIAGSYTAVTAFALEGSARTRMLVIIWVAAVIGIVIRMAWLDAPYALVAVVYVAVGWIMVIDLSGYLDGLSGGETGLIALGGLLYTGGAAIYAMHRPNPWPRTFGYHELFHALVAVAALAHYVAVFSLVEAR